jgi:4-hydroxy-2-oxoheptanedioate aldolase
MEKFHPSLTTQDYLLQANTSLTTIVQIETKEALANVDAIASTEGVDVLLVGPFDLGNNIGHPIFDGKMDKELEEAIDFILKAAEKAGKRTGIFCTSGEQSKHFADKGFNMVSIAADMLALPAYVTETLQKAKGETSGGAKVTGPYGR